MLGPCIMLFWFVCVLHRTYCRIVFWLFWQWGFNYFKIVLRYVFIVKGKCCFLLLGCEKNDWLRSLVQYNLTIGKTVILMEQPSCLLQKRISSCPLETQYYIFTRPFIVWVICNVHYVKTTWRASLFALFCPHALLFLCWYYWNSLALVVNCYRSRSSFFSSI